MIYNLKHYAYIGDAVYELFIRELVIEKTTQQNKMHEFSTKFVCANAQADILDKIIPYFTDDELDIQKRGRNLKITINKRNNPAVHSLATSFETVIGYLYLNKKDRLKEIFDIIKKELKELN